MIDVTPLRAAVKAAPGDALVVEKVTLEQLFDQIERLQRTLINIGSQARAA